MSMKKQENVFQPDVEIHFRQEPMSWEQLKELFGGIDLNDHRSIGALNPVDLEALPRYRCGRCGDYTSTGNKELCSSCIEEIKEKGDDGKFY